MTMMTGLECHLCHTRFPAEALFVCDQCFGPLEPVYDYDAVKKVLTRELIESRPRNLWRYRELLPITGEPRTGFTSGFTPLVRADRLAAKLGVKELYIKDDGVNHPTLSYKDRVVSVAATRAVELGFTTFGCASTGNLGNSVAAHAARLGLECYVFIPDNLETGKVVGSGVYQPHLMAIRGNYDDVNRLCTQVADKYHWGFANINLRSYYAEGAKTFGFEIVEQLGWKFPKHVVSPVAGGTLLPRIARGFRELRTVGLVEGDLPKMYAAQAEGCAPVVRALHDGLDHPDPVKPDTIAKSIAIGNPADGFQVLETLRATGGWGEMATDEELLAAIELLAATEGIFTEPAGGTTLAVAKKLIEQGRIPRDESIVVCITGNGYKTSEIFTERLRPAAHLGRALKDFDAFIAARPEAGAKAGADTAATAGAVKTANGVGA
jgi:threonine synthase